MPVWIFDASFVFSFGCGSFLYFYSVCDGLGVCCCRPDSMIFAGLLFRVVFRRRRFLVLVVVGLGPFFDGLPFASVCSVVFVTLEF